MGVRQLLIFFVLFLEKLHGKAGSLGGVGDMGPHVPHHGAVSLDLVCFSFLPLFQICLILAMAAHNLFPASLTGAPRPPCMVPFLAASLE